MPGPLSLLQGTLRLTGGGKAHLPPMLVHGSSQGVAGATGEDAHRRLHRLFPVRAI